MPCSSVQLTTEVKFLGSMLLLQATRPNSAILTFALREKRIYLQLMQLQHSNFVFICYDNPPNFLIGISYWAFMSCHLRFKNFCLSVMSFYCNARERYTRETAVSDRLSIFLTASNASPRDRRASTMSPASRWASAMSE